MQSFSVLTKIKAGPLREIALAKRCLRSKPTGLMCPTPETELERREKEDFDHLENILLFFHTTCTAAVAAAILEGDRHVLFGTWMGLPLTRS